METAILVMLVGAQKALLATTVTVQRQNSKKWSQQTRQMSPLRWELELMKQLKK